MPRFIWCAACLGLGLLSVACSAEWRDENREQEAWWNLAERGPPPTERDDPFACGSSNGYQCAVSSRAFRESQCDDGDAYQCFLLGRTLLLTGRPSRDAAAAQAALERACRLGWVKGDKGAIQSCTLLGIAHLIGWHGFKANEELGVQLLGERCMAHDDLACSFAAYALERGLGVEQDIPAAVASYDRLCTVRRDGFADGSETKPPAGSKHEEFACLRLAVLADEGAIEAPEGGGVEFVAQLYAEVCFRAEGPAPLGVVACPKAARMFIEHGYTFRQFRGTVRYIRATGGAMLVVGWDPPDDADPELLAKLGCSDGSDEACEMLRKMFEAAEASGEVFDLRDKP